MAANTAIRRMLIASLILAGVVAILAGIGTRPVHVAKPNVTQAQVEAKEEEKAQEAAREKDAEERRQQYAAWAHKNPAAAKLQLKHSWSQDMCEVIAANKIRIGMNTEQVLAAWGKPNHINRSVGATYVQEQWVYGDHQYLYFDNDILTSWQDQK
jgi:hypothetical protein